MLTSDTDNTFLSGLLIGLSISFILYGVMVAQAWIYTSHCKEDPRWLKSTVSSVLVLETLHTVFMVVQIYHYAIVGFGRPDIISRVHWTVPGIVITENIVVALVQAFYVYRVWLLSNNSRAWLIGMSIPVLAQFVSIIVGTVSAASTPTWEEYRTRTENKVGVNLANITTVVADTAVAAAMVYHLWRSEPCYKRTDSVLRWLMAYSVNTGALTALIALATVITYTCVTDNLVYAGLVVISGKISANSMLGALNARHVLRDRLSITSTYLDSSFRTTLQFQNPDVEAASPIGIGSDRLPFSNGQY